MLGEEVKEVMLEEEVKERMLGEEVKEGMLGEEVKEVMSNICFSNRGNTQHARWSHRMSPVRCL